MEEGEGENPDKNEVSKYIEGKHNVKVYTDASGTLDNRVGLALQI